MKRILILLAGLLAAAIPASAQQPVGVNQPVEFLVAAGSSSGTYKVFLDQIRSITNDVITFKEVDSHGSVENLDCLVNNKAMGAFMHSDVIYFRAQSTDLSRFKTLIPLFKEEVHFLALTNSKRFTGGTLGYGKTQVVINTVDDLGRPVEKLPMKVGAAGGGFITAQVIRLQAQLGYEVVQFGSGSEVMNALNAGTIDAAVFVGGAPLPNLEKLGPDYKLLPMGDTTATRLKAVYSPASVTYIRMRPEAIQTVSADCIFVSREYKTPKYVNALRAFRDQFNARLEELRETPGAHQKWQEVIANGPSKWPVMTFGVEAPVVAAPGLTVR